jgi:hypothetical protein
MKILVNTLGTDSDPSSTILRPIKKIPDGLPVSQQVIESQGPGHEELRKCLESLGHSERQFNAARIAMLNWIPVRLSSITERTIEETGNGTTRL